MLRRLLVFPALIIIIVAGLLMWARRPPLGHVVVVGINSRHLVGTATGTTWNVRHNDRGIPRWVSADWVYLWVPAQGLYRQRLAGGRMEPIIPYPDAFIVGAPPDAAWILYERRGHTYWVRGDGTGHRQIVPPIVYNEAGQWLLSPDVSQTAIGSADGAVYMMSLDAQQVRRLDAPPAANLVEWVDPDWIGAYDAGEYVLIAADGSGTLRPRINESPAVSAHAWYGKAVVLRNESGSLGLLDLEEGEMIWQIYGSRTGEAPFLSPDFVWHYVQRGDELIRRHLETDEEQRVATIPGGIRRLYWGDETLTALVYQDSAYHLYSMRPDGRELTHIYQFAAHTVLCQSLDASDLLCTAGQSTYLVEGQQVHHAFESPRWVAVPPFEQHAHLLLLLLVALILLRLGYNGF